MSGPVRVASLVGLCAVLAGCSVIDAFSGDLDCDLEENFDDPSCQVSQDCTPNVDCPDAGGEDGGGNVCSEAINLVNLGGSDSNDTSSGFTDDFSSTSTGGLCSPSSSGAPDVFYALAGDPGDVFDVVLTPSFDGVVSVMQGCSPSQCVGYVDTGGPGTTESFSFTAATTTPYQLVVDGFEAGQQGGYSLSVTSSTLCQKASPSGSPELDTCGDAEDLTGTLASGNARVYGSTDANTSALDPNQSACGLNNAPNTNVPDALYRFDVTSATKNNLWVRIVANFDPVIYVLDACSSGATCIKGVDTVSATAVNQLDLTIPNFPVGTYYLVVDGFSTGDTGCYSLDVSLYE